VNASFKKDSGRPAIDQDILMTAKPSYEELEERKNSKSRLFQPGYYRPAAN
jgi:hypothetical protein